MDSPEIKHICGQCGAGFTLEEEYLNHLCLVTGVKPGGEPASDIQPIDVPPLPHYVDPMTGGTVDLTPPAQEEMTVPAIPEIPLQENMLPEQPVSPIETEKNIEPLHQDAPVTPSSDTSQSPSHADAGFDYVPTVPVTPPADPIQPVQAAVQDTVQVEFSDLKDVTVL